MHISRGKLASSLEASYGYVRYWIDAILPDLWASSETPFGYRNVLIYDVVDTNSPQSFSVIPRGQLSFQNGCCGGRDADIKVRLNRCIFMPGEVIVASCKGYNFSGHVLRPYLQLLYNFRTGSRQSKKIQEN